MLHLAGHGNATGGLLGADAEGRTIAIKGSRLAQVLVSHRNIRLVILGACDQLDHAKALSQLVDCVITSSDKLPDDVARHFSRAPYKGLAHGQSVGDAFERAVAITGLSHEEQADVLRLVCRDLVDPRWVYISPAPVQSEAAVDLGLNERTRAAFAQVVDGTDDVVLVANVVAPWRTIVPAHPHAEPHVVEIDVGTGGWQRDFPPDVARWQAALEETRARVHEAKASGRSRTHVVAKLPYSLAAVLASELEQHDREVVFYQETPPPGGQGDVRVWQPWGPGLRAARPTQRRSPVFAPPLLPSMAVERECELAVLVSVSQKIDLTLARQAIGAEPADIQTIHLVPAGEIGRRAVDQTTIDTAAEKMADTLERAMRSHPMARALHLFFSGPVALLMRAAGRLHLQPKPIYLYEWFPRTPSGPRYLRTLDLGGRSLTLDP